MCSVFLFVCVCKLITVAVWLNDQQRLQFGCLLESTLTIRLCFFFFFCYLYISFYFDCVIITLKISWNGLFTSFFSSKNLIALAIHRCCCFFGIFFCLMFRFNENVSFLLIITQKHSKKMLLKFYRWRNESAYFLWSWIDRSLYLYHNYSFQLQAIKLAIGNGLCALNHYGSNRMASTFKPNNCLFVQCFCVVSVYVLWNNFFEQNTLVAQPYSLSRTIFESKTKQNTKKTGLRKLHPIYTEDLCWLIGAMNLTRSENFSSGFFVWFPYASFRSLPKQVLVWKNSLYFRSKCVSTKGIPRLTLLPFSLRLKAESGFDPYV